MISKNQMGLILAGIYVFLVFVTSDSLMLFVASAILFAGVLLSCYKKKVALIKGNTYFTIQFIFIGWCLIQLIFNIAVLKDVSWSAARRLLINCIDEMFLFNILIRQKNIETIFKTFIYPISAGLTLIMLLQLRAGNLFSNRLNSTNNDGEAYKFLGLTINAGVATLIGHCAVCLFAFCIIIYYAQKHKRYIAFGILALVALLLTSSRKAIIIAVILFVAIPLLQERNIKKWEKMMLFLVAIIIAYNIIMNVPELYNLVGVRFERMFTMFSTGKAIDKSMKIRSNLLSLGWNAFKEHPIVGYGVNSFKELFNHGTIYSHCNYLELMVGTGIIGLLIYLLKYVYLFVESVKIIINDEKALNKYYGISICIWLLLVWVMEFWQVAYYNERMIVHYTFILAIIYKIKKEKMEYNKMVNTNDDIYYYSI